jgi:hypothetical protein
MSAVRDWELLCLSIACLLILRYFLVHVTVDNASWPKLLGRGEEKQAFKANNYRIQ